MVMKRLEYNFTNFGGIDTETPSSTGTVLRANNVEQIVDLDSASSKNYGFIQKVPALTQLGNTVGTTSSRGLYLFIPLDSYATNYYIVQAFSDGTVRYLDNATNLWTTIFTETGGSGTGGINGNLQYDFETYGNILYFTNGENLVQKWKPGWTTSRDIVDLGATPVDITGTLTFTENDLNVTCPTDLTAQLSVGDWIQAGDNLTWYEIDTITYSSQTEIILVNRFVETTTTVTVANRADNATITARFLHIFKDRLFYASGSDSLLPLTDVMDIYDAIEEGGLYTFPEVDPNSPFTL